MYDFLKKVPLFSGMPEEDLDRLCEMVDEISLNAGEVLFKEGAPGDRAFVIKEGQLEILKSSSGRDVLLAVRKVGEVIGEMALVEDAPRMASVRARVPTLLLTIHKDQIDHLLNTSSSAARAMLTTILGRLRSSDAMLRQSEKMAQLGTLTAGVAHELNNPAAAVARSSSLLQEAMNTFETAHDGLASAGLSDSQWGLLRDLGESARLAASHPAEMDSLARSDREYEIEEWLDEQGMNNAWELAPTLVDLNYTVDNLSALAQGFEVEQISPVIDWLGAMYHIHSLLYEIGQGAGRISEIVKSLKTYSYLDQAPVQAVDVHEGLESTLVILRNKLKSGVSVRREYGKLPKIQAYGSELNQVWTNLLDNAADALLDGGTADPLAHPEIVIRTRHEGDWIIVEIADNGRGIPAEVLPRIFDPFFTTKPPGKGTGLGLEISYNIIVNRHSGDVKVFSEPGLTQFQVFLPVNFQDMRDKAIPMATVRRAEDDELRQILTESTAIATVGYSNDVNRPAHSVPAYLQSKGYRIIPVNPNVAEGLGQKAYPDLTSIPEPVDVVQIFRPSSFVPEIVEQAIEIGAKTVWMQEGIVNEQAAAMARRAGMHVVMDTCMRTAHRRLMA